MFNLVLTLCLFTYLCGRYSFGVGHNGADYGTYAHSAYLPSLDIGLSIILNHDQLLEVNGTKITRSAEEIFCRAYRAIFHLMLRGVATNFDIDSSFVCDKTLI